MSDEVYSQVFTIEEAAAYLRMSVSTFRKYVYETKKIEPVFTPAALKRFNQNRDRKPNRTPMSAKVNKLEDEVRDLKRRVAALEANT